MCPSQLSWFIDCAIIEYLSKEKGLVNPNTSNFPQKCGIACHAEYSGAMV